MENVLNYPRSWATTALLLAAVLGAAATQAGEKPGYVLTAYADAVGGEQLLSGHYSAALVNIHSAPVGAAGPLVVTKTNACVAYTMMHKLRDARVACDAAIVAATADRSHATGVVAKSRTQEDSAVATAYSNRAVVHYLSHETVGSAEDLAEAHNLAPQSQYVVSNIAAFKQMRGVTPALAVGAQRIED